jgi:RTX calcium-binding nonapeptide repeat (4 copies)
MFKKAVGRGVRRSARRVLLVAAGGVLVALAVSVVGPTGSALGYVSKDGSVSDDPNALTHHPDWMKALPASLPLGALSIPGSHDSIAVHNTFAEDQSMSIPDQLESGMRFFDIRTACEGNGPPWKLEGKHGIIDQDITLETVLNQTVTFLDNHPGETILMRVSGDGVAPQLCKQKDGTYVPQKRAFVDQYWWTQLHNKSRLFWQPPQTSSNPAPPTLGEARGHIVLLPGSYYTWDDGGHDPKGHWIPAMPAPVLGLSYDSFENPARYTPGGKAVTIVDRPDVCHSGPYTPKDKVYDTEDTIRFAAAQSPAESSQHIEAASTEGSDETPWPEKDSCTPAQTSRATADFVNPAVLSSIIPLTAVPQIGVVFGDWFGPKLIDAIISRNPQAVGCQDATVAGTGGSEALSGTAGNDVIEGAHGNDVIHGAPGNDRICGGPGNDVIQGGPGNDMIEGGNGNDVIHGGPGNDVIYGGNGNDVIYGGPGNDVIHGGNGNDVIEGGRGSDTIYAADGRRDLIDCGAGRDTAIVDPHDTVAGNCERVILKKG